MGRKRRAEIQVTEDNTAGRRSGRGRKLALLLALAGAVAFFVRRKQRKSEIDQGVWHEAPST